MRLDVALSFVVRSSHFSRSRTCRRYTIRNTIRTEQADGRGEAGFSCNIAISGLCQFFIYICVYIHKYEEQVNVTVRSDDLLRSSHLRPLSLLRQTRAKDGSYQARISFNNFTIGTQYVKSCPAWLGFLTRDLCKGCNGAPSFFRL